jgi:hypothetical protein
MTLAGFVLQVTNNSVVDQYAQTVVCRGMESRSEVCMTGEDTLRRCHQAAVEGESD